MSGGAERSLSGPRHEPLGEELSQLLFESVRDYAILALDPEGRIVSWNIGAQRIKGYAPEEVMGRHFSMFYPADARAAGDPERHLERAKRDGRVETEGWRVRSDGTRFWARVVITALFRGGELRGYGKVTADRTSEREAEEALRRRERQLAEAQQIAHLGSWEWDLGRDTITGSKELYRIFGLEPREELDYDEYLELLFPEDRDKVEATARRSVEEGTAYVHEHRIVRPDGEVRWVQSRGEVTADGSGRTVRMVGTSLDITEIKRAEEKARALATEQAARREAEAMARRMGFLAEASALLGASLEYEETLQTVAWLAVPSFADWCSVDILASDGGIRRLAVAHLDPERLEAAQELEKRYPTSVDAEEGLGRVLRTGEPDMVEELDPSRLETVAWDEEHLELLRDLGLRSYIIVPIMTRERPLGAITFVYAESDRRYTREDLVVAQELASRAGLAIENAQLHEAEREARRHAERASDRTSRLQAITAGLSEAVTPASVAAVVVDAVVAATEARSGALALAEEDGSLELVRTVGVADNVEQRYRRFDVNAQIPLAEAIRTGSGVWAETGEERDARYPALAEIRRSSGTGAVAAVPIRTGDRILGALAFAWAGDREMSHEDREFLLAIGRQCAQALERAYLYETEHAAREAAEAASQAKTQFVAMMSHELRTPLAAIIGYQELLSEGITGPVTDRQKEQLHRIRASATHLRDLINQILSMSRIEAGKEEVLWEEVDATEVTRDVVILMEGEAESAGIGLDLTLPPGPVPIETDPAKLRQILLNLISNAIKFTEEGSVEVTVDTTPSDLRIRVVDTGIGIAGEDRERIFEAFTQVDQSMTRRAGGSGLGLAVSLHLARLLGGSLTLQSEPTVGSTFTLTLPRGDGAE